MKAIVWSKINCPYCVSAVALLKQKGYDIEERKIGVDWSKDQLLESVPMARTVPQIFLGDEYIGGYDKLQEYFKVKGVE